MSVQFTRTTFNRQEWLPLFIPASILTDEATAGNPLSCISQGWSRHTSGSAVGIGQLKLVCPRRKGGLDAPLQTCWGCGVRTGYPVGSGFQHTNHCFARSIRRYLLVDRAGGQGLLDGGEFICRDGRVFQVEPPFGDPWLLFGDENYRIGQGIVLPAR